MNLFLEQLFNGLAIGAIYALITLGLALVYGILGVLHVAHAGIYTIGAYVGYGVFVATGSLALAFAVSMAFCALAGVAIERFVYAPLMKYPPYVPLISSIALFMAVEEICRLIAGPYVLSFSTNLPFPALSFAGIRFSPNLVGIYVISGVIFLLLWFLTTRTEIGLALRATAMDAPPKA